MSVADPPTPCPGQPQPSKRVLPAHPLRTAAVEACARIGEPLSARLICEVLGCPADFPTVAYHVVRLADAGVFAAQPGAAPEGPTEHFYRLAA
jgi:hypothetical protein